jgi:F-type H+-transporting ATPase subunit b
MAQKNATPTTTTTEHIPGSEHGKGFPPFDPTSFASQLLWLSLTFVALYLLMSRVALPRVGAILENRSQRIAGDLAEAQKLKEQSDAAIAAHEKALADARSRAQALANETIQKQNSAAAETRKGLEAQLHGRIAEAEKAITATRTAAMTNVQAIATEAASAIVERLTGTTPASQDVAAAVSGALKR